MKKCNFLTLLFMLVPKIRQLNNNFYLYVA